MKTYIKLCIISFICVFACISGYACTVNDSITVYGQVIDDIDEPRPLCFVLRKKNILDDKVLTDFEGYFSIRVPKNATLYFQAYAYRRRIKAKKLSQDKNNPSIIKLKIYKKEWNEVTYSD